MQTPRPVNVRQQFLEEFEIAFPVENDHRDVMAILGRSDEAGNVLGNDVLEERGFPGARHSENNALHNAYIVRPQPWFFVHVVAEHYGILLPSCRNGAFILPGGDYEWRALLPRSTRGVSPQGRRQYRGGDDAQVDPAFEQLLASYMKSGDGQIKHKGDRPEQEDSADDSSFGVRNVTPVLRTM